jgi:kinesin family protein 12
VQEYQFELNRMKSENEELRNAREIAEKNYHVVMNNNNALQIKLENIGIILRNISLHTNQNITNS